ncbi:MAG TPA: hypothetical protein VM187_01125, partial [Niastella sp.]|nr:hypothetical protein [Niastella sp.]
QNVYAYNLASCYLENNSNKSFRVKPLPIAAQFSRVSGIVVTDVDGDKKEDLLLHGNDFSWRAQLGNMDGSLGVVCRGDGAGNFKQLPVSQVGIIANGAVQDMALIANGSERFIVTTKNNAPIETRRLERKSK